MAKKGWSKWRLLIEVDPKDIESLPGCYVISCGKAINRVIGRDPDGVIDIGESGNLKTRIRAFMTFGSHSAALRYKNHKMDKVFPWSKLLIRWKYKEDKKSAQAEERRLLLKYLKKHYELPPLNYKAEWKIK